MMMLSRSGSRQAVRRVCLTAQKHNRIISRVPQIKNTPALSATGSIFHSSSVVNKYQSSFSEPEPSLFRLVENASDVDAPLRSNIRTMGGLLGRVIRLHDGDEIFTKVEAMRQMAKEWRLNNKSEAGLLKLATFASQLSNRELYRVSRAFTHFLAIANAAECHHRIRRLAASKQDDDLGALYPKKDSCGGVLPFLLDQGHSPDAIYEALIKQTTELVLTAHPTEVNRRTILDKYRRIQKILTQADIIANRPNKFETMELDDALWREISSLWLSDEVSRQKPTPEDEAERGTLVLETVLWRAVPLFLRKLNATCQEFLNRPLPLEAHPVKFASWMGGDRDGNPNVSPETTRKVTLKNRIKAATLFAEDVKTLEAALSGTMCSEELCKIVGTNIREPYRAYLAPIRAKLERTAQWAEQQLAKLQPDEETSLLGHLDPVSTQEIYLCKDEFRNDLMVLYRSLCDTGNETTAAGLLTDVLRNISAFGLTLIPLDVRQESDKHEEAIDAITRFLGQGSYSQWDESTKVQWLITQIASKRPLIRSGVWRDYPEFFSQTAVDTLEIFQMISEQHPDSLGAYVISQATHASDVLAVLLLQLDAGVKKPLRVAPLFETLDDLQGATHTMRTLFTEPVYMGIINGRQEIMIGYSDSAKDAGRLSAVYAQFETQEQLAFLAKEYDVDLTFFHGKGGTVGRGGNPQTFLAIMSHAPGTINGQFRVTEQGEMINQHFGYGDRAERTMDIYTAAVLAERLTPRPAPKDEWRTLMQHLSAESCQAYRQVVRQDPRFVPYFRAATPELELASLNIGSRPAKRKATGGVESLRAIPWNFAWTQTRFNLPTWLGVGQALQTTLDSPTKAPLLKDMYLNWDSFRMMVDLVEMVLAKSDPQMAQHYESMLVSPEQVEAKELGSQVRKVHLDTERAILTLTQHKILGENNPILQRALTVRNPYVDCLNVLQAETLKRIRLQGDTPDPKLKDALMTTITGVANGMGNTG